MYQTQIIRVIKLSLTAKIGSDYFLEKKEAFSLIEEFFGDGQKFLFLLFFTNQFTRGRSKIDCPIPKLSFSKRAFHPPFVLNSQEVTFKNT